MSAKRSLLALLLVLLPLSLFAAEGKSDYVEYIELQPPFITNYGGVGPLKYLKAEVSIRVHSRGAEAKIKHNQAHIRNNLVMLFSRQTDEAVSSPAGREKLRLEAIESIRQIMVSEYGEEGFTMLSDLLFTSFVTQN
ncbi:MAG: flagellar basal body-associated FliL family protein [Halopseudomonas sp.]